MNDNIGNPWHKITRKKYLLRGLSIFVLITLGSFAALFIFNESANLKQIISTIRPVYIIVLILLVLLDWTLGAYRNHIYASILRPGISFKVCWEANLANVFVGAVTPSQSGGGPAQFYVFYKNGITIHESLAISVVNYIATVIFLPTAAWLGLHYLGEDFTHPILLTLMKSAIGIFSLVIILVLVSLLIPTTISKGLSTLALKFSDGSTISNWLEIGAGSLVKYHKIIIEFLTKKWYLFPFTVLLTISLYTNKFLIVFVILLSLGVPVSLLSIFASQALIFFILYFAPTPGAAGIAELSLSSLMISIVPMEYMSLFTASHRVFLLILPAIIGGYVMVKYLGRKSNDSDNPD